MPETDDIALLKQFAETDSEPAFAGIVSRHLNLVYSTALRATGNTHAAQEISQAVFIILARKAKSLGAKTILSGWLHQTTRLTAANYLRGEIRRQKREQETFMQSTLNEPDSEVWRQIAPVLDDAISKLGAKDRDAIVLRFFENKSLGEVGAALGASEDAAKMRVNRALEKLRKLFSKRGVSLTTAIIAGAVSANSVQAAPVGLAKTISAVAIAKGAVAGGSTLALVKGALKIMAWTKMKTAVVAGVAVLLTAGMTVVAVKTIRSMRAQPDIRNAQESVAQTQDGGNLPAGEIFKKAQETYAALTSYSDEGKTVANLNGMTFTTTFTIKLSRPNFYRIEWAQPETSSYVNKGVVWSAGEGDFMVMGDGNAQNERSRETALAGATGVSGSAAATIPGTFFKMNWGNQFSGSVAGEKQLPNEKVGDADCYVFTSELKGTTKTLWIGKQDFLIHQVQTVTSAEAMKAATVEAAKRNPQIAARMPKTEYTDDISTETHENIVVNQKLSPADFAR